MRFKSDSGQALIETVLMIALFTVLLSAIIQVFLVHNYTFQMANNAYYSLFKDKAYGTYNKPTHRYEGYPNWPHKPLRSVSPLKQAGGKVQAEVGGVADWTGDDRAAIPMMPFFENAIVTELRNRNVRVEKVRLKLGNYEPGLGYLRLKVLWMGMGTEGGFKAFFGMIEGLFRMAPQLGASATNYTDGYDEDDLKNQQDQYENQDDNLNNQDTGEEAKDKWDADHGDNNHDGYHDKCEEMNGNNHPSCKNDRPWE